MGPGYMVQRMEDYIVPLSRFNNGEGGKILAEVKAVGAKAIFKKNKREAVILSPELYDELMDMLADYRIEQIAAERREAGGESLSFAEAAAQAGLAESDLKGWEHVEIE